MAQTIKLKRSANTTLSSGQGIPTTSDLALGEVAINTYHGTMYIKKNDGTDAIVEIGGASSGALPLTGGTLTGTLNFGDNVRARFGASNDLQIYHNATNSIIADTGSGFLSLQSNGTEIALYDAANNANMGRFITGGAVNLFYNGDTKFQTTNTGINVTGTATMDGLTVQTSQGNISIPTNTSSLNFARAGFNYIRATDVSGSFSFITGANDFATQRLNIASNGDISFYEDTGADAKLFWDASAEVLAIGHVSPSASYSLDAAKGIRSFGNAPNFTLREDDASNQTWLMASYGGTFAVRDTTAAGTTYPFQIQAAAPNKTLFLKSDGNVGIGTTTPEAKLQISHNGGHTSGTVQVSESSFDLFNPLQANTDEKGSLITFSDNYYDGTNYHRTTRAGLKGGTDVVGNNASGFLSFYTNGGSGNALNETMRITAAGNVGIGTTAPDAKLRIDQDAATVGLKVTGGSGGINIAQFIRDVGGNASVNINASSADPQIQFVSPSNTFSVGVNSNTFEIADNSVLGTNTRFSITNAGNVGIGTSAPTEKLHIHGGGIYTTPVTYAGNQDGWALKIGASNNAGWDFSGIKLRVNSTGSPRMSLMSRGAESMSLDGGNVGIGTDYATDKLDVAGALRLTTNISFDANKSGRIYKASNHGLSFHGVTGTANDFAMFTASGQLMVVNPTGTNNLSLVPAAGHNVGIGTTAPAAKLQVEELGIDTTTTSTTATTQVAIDSMVAATFRSARYTIQVTNSTDSTYHLTEMLLIHNGTTPSINEFGTIFTGSASEAAFTADINSGNVRILATPASTDAMAFKVIRHSITV